MDIVHAVVCVLACTAADDCRLALYVPEIGLQCYHGPVCLACLLDPVAINPCKKESPCARREKSCMFTSTQCFVELS